MKTNQPRRFPIDQLTLRGEFALTGIPPRGLRVRYVTETPTNDSMFLGTVTRFPRWRSGGNRMELAPVVLYRPTQALDAVMGQYLDGHVTRASRRCWRAEAHVLTPYDWEEEN